MAAVFHSKLILGLVFLVLEINILHGIVPEIRQIKNSALWFSKNNTKIENKLNTPYLEFPVFF